MKEPREMFSAIFEKYDSEAELAKNSIQLFDIRSRKGGVIKDNLVFAEKECEDAEEFKPRRLCSILGKP